jgi:Sigma-70, region 4
VPEGLSEREADIYRWRVVNRLTYREIAVKLNDEISEARICQIMKEVRAKLPPLDLEGMRAESLALHHEIQRKALALAELAGAPVTAGKDGDVLYDPDGHVIVRDYSGRIAALKLASDADKEIRKLHGLDAAQKVAVSGSVRYEVAGVDVTKMS